MPLYMDNNVKRIIDKANSRTYNEFYKFHPFNNHLIQLLTYNQFYCARYHELNDPFDCFVNMNIHAIEYYIRKPNFEGTDISDVIAKYRVPKPWIDYHDEKKRRQIETTHDDETLAALLSADMEMQSNFINDIIDKIGVGVCSFVKAEDEWKDTNLMMWAHYADNSNGVRLCFNFNEDTEIKDKLHEVKYERVIFTAGTRPVKEAFHHKLKYFKDENEVRIVHDNPYIFFDKESLRDITFGMNVSGNHAATIIDLTKSLGYDCKYYYIRKTATGLEPLEIISNEEEMVADNLRKQTDVKGKA